MKRFVLAMVGLSALVGCSQTEKLTGSSRQEMPLVNWKFLKSDPLQAEKPQVSDLLWQRVTVPHTWNNLDGEDGGFDKGGNYLRVACWYRRNLAVTDQMMGKTLVLKFEGANRRTDVFVNGEKAGTHIGGFAAFTFDITKFIHPGDNVLAVRVDNENDDDSPPLSADFTFFGGLYRPAELLVLDPVHISPLDNGSSGVTIHTPSVTDTSATVTVRSEIQNKCEEPEDVHIITHIFDSQGIQVSQSEVAASLKPATTQPVDATLTVDHPHRWNGRKDPYLYRVAVDVLRDGKVVDEVTQPLGIRTFSIDKDNGFILNGQSYPLHGVSRHQDRLDKGWAISNADHDQDMALIKEMGCTAIRLAHYQHAEYFYELCDKEGIVVWAEVPVVNAVNPGKPFADNAKQQLTELIRQNVNHPSICFWSIGNEISSQRSDPTPLLKEMNDLAHKEDSSRITTMAFAVPSRGYNREWPGITDTFGQNRYYAWYRGEFSDIPGFLKSQGSIAVSEYGAGASIYFHNENPTRQDHSEEYQCLFHETYWPLLKANPHVWGTFVWNMFDFAADQRKEGDHAGRNDKGMVTYDRKTRKDVFYYYKANWSDEPVLHINSTRFTVRGLQQIPVKVYSNWPRVELIVNGQSAGEKNGENCVFVWDKISLNQGPNQVIARAVKDGKTLEDSCTWTYTPGAPTEVDVAQDNVMRDELKKGPPRPAPDPAAAAPTTAQ